MRRLIRGWLAAGMAATLFQLAPAGLARVVTVGIANGNQLQFFPSVTNIATGDQVVWVWNNTSNTHSTTDSGLWDSGLQASGTFTNTFNSAGTFNYECSKHFSFGMTASVVVVAVSQPPNVALTNPIPGTVFAAPANVSLNATASAPAGTVTNLQFLVGTTVLTNETAAPYAVTAGNLAAGAYTASALATDNHGLRATNSVSFSVVTAVPVILNTPVRPSASSFQFSFTANVGLSYLVQRSADLPADNWVPLLTNKANASLMNVTDFNATGSPGFYRVARLPNP